MSKPPGQSLAGLIEASSERNGTAAETRLATDLFQERALIERDVPSVTRQAAFTVGSPLIGILPQSSTYAARQPIQTFVRTQSRAILFPPGEMIR